MTTNNLDWLWKPTTDKVEEFESDIVLSEGGGGDFSSAQIGEWTAGPQWMIQTDLEVDLSVEGHTFEGKARVPWANLWYWNGSEDGYKAAKLVSDALREKFQPEEDWKFRQTRQWHFRMPTNLWINYRSKDKKAEDSWGEAVEFDVPMATWQLGNKRHEFHLMMLPSFVQEVGLATGMLKTRIFDYATLPGTKAKFEYTDQERLIGLDNKWEGSELGQARIALWNELGEENPMAYTTGKEAGKYKTSSPKLSTILRILYQNESTFWAGMTRVASPHVKNVSKKTGEQRPAYVCTSFYRDRTAAEADSGVERVDDGLPQLPSEWEGVSKNEFMQSAKDFLAQNKVGWKSKPAAMVEKAIRGLDGKIQENLIVNADQLIEWLPYLDQ